MKHIAKYNNSAPVNNWSNFIDDFFNNSLSNVIGSDMTASQPAVNIIENKENYRIDLAVPGLEKEDFNINVEKENLIIEAKKEVNETTSQGKFTRQEFNYTSFKRNFQLPENVNVEGIGAVYEHGILKVTLPKITDAEDTTVKTIEIE